MRLPGPGRLVRHGPVAVDQAVSSASNFLLALLVAQSATAADFGRFAIATSVYWLVLGGVRALIAEPLLILQARDGRSPAQMSSAVGLAINLALLGSVVGVAVTALHGPGPIGWLLVTLPVLVWQDVLRYCAFSLGRPIEALVSDATWLLLFLGIGGLVLVLGGAPGVSDWLVLWAGCAAVPAVTASVRVGVWPAWSRQRDWWSRSRRQAVPMLGDFAVLSVSENGFVLLLPLVTSFALLGQVKAALVVSGPLSVVMTAASVAALPLLARGDGPDRKVPVRAGVLAGACMAAVAVCFALVLLVIPPAWGHRLFGDVWTGIGVLPVLIALYFAVLCFNQGAVLVLRAIGEVRRLLVGRLVLAPASVVVPLVAARLGGATALGVAAIALGAVYGLTWWSIVARVRRRSPAVAAEPVRA
jgi:O-antigen/teichoic acid export membrane protein